MKILTLILTIFLLTGCDTNLDHFKDGYRVVRIDAADGQKDLYYYSIESYFSTVKLLLHKDFAQIGDYLVVSNNAIIAVKK